MRTDASVSYYLTRTFRRSYGHDLKFFHVERPNAKGKSNFDIDFGFEVHLEYMCLILFDSGLDYMCYCDLDL